MSKGRTTLAEIAGAAGVSVATVSKVLNDRADVAAETRRRVQKHLRDSEYRPAGSHSTRHREQGRSIEVVFPELQNAYIIGVLEGITSSAAAEGFEVVIGRVLSPDSTLINPQALLRSERVAPSSSPQMPPARRSRRLDDAGFPVVVVDPLRVGDSRMHHHRCDQLHRRSHGRRIPSLPGAPAHRPRRRAASVELSHARLAGYSSALRKAGIELDETLVTHCAFTYDAGRQAARDLLDRPDRPTAIFAANDEIALGVMEEARRRSIRIPEDLSVVGFDDTFLASRSAHR